MGKETEQKQEIVNQGVHTYSQEEAYVWPEEPVLREQLEWFQDQKLALMVHWGVYNQLGMCVEHFSHVMHLGSTVVGDLREDKDAVDAVDAILPAGTLSGAPKFRACQIIEELEHSKRGIYGGAIGYLDFTGNLDTCIAIRLVYKKKGEICIRSGAGIVADSVPEKEFEECCNKARAVVQAIAQAQEGLE